MLSKIIITYTMYHSSLKCCIDNGLLTLAGATVPSLPNLYGKEQLGNAVPDDTKSEVYDHQQ